MTPALYTSSAILSKHRSRKGLFLVRAPDSEIFPHNFTKTDADLIVSTLNGVGDALALEAWIASEGDSHISRFVARHLANAEGLHVAAA